MITFPHKYSIERLLWLWLVIIFAENNLRSATIHTGSVCLSTEFYFCSAACFKTAWPKHRETCYWKKDEERVEESGEESEARVSVE